MGPQLTDETFCNDLIQRKTNHSTINKYLEEENRYLKLQYILFANLKWQNMNTYDANCGELQSFAKKVDFVCFIPQEIKHEYCPHTTDEIDSQVNKDSCNRKFGTEIYPCIYENRAGVI